MAPSHSIPLPSIQVGELRIMIEGDPAGFQPTLAAEEIEPQLHLVHLELTADCDLTPKPLKIVWRQPIVDIHSVWYPGCDTKRGLTMPWEITVKSKATSQAPVICLHNPAGQNRLTLACSDVLNPVESTASVHEATATFFCHIHFFNQPTAPLRHYKATLRLDQRPRPYYESLRDVQVWWTSLPGLAPSPVPDIARLPMYSTWYSFHQEMTATAVETQCRLVKDFGCDAVIIDDGWQTEDNQGNYAYCGDWEVAPGKFPDMAAHVARIHQSGMKCLLWFSVPFIGFESRAYSSFAGKYLCKLDHLKAAVLDPRFPEVRDYLINLYENAVRNWDLDGLKLDFVDQFSATAGNYGDEVEGRDIDSVPEAADRLLRDTMSRLRKLKPDILVEFRQSYIGPLMRNYGNLFRAADCPNDALTNRVRTLDIRLLAGTTATHSDMLMWSPEESVESAALQFLNILFSVPQISVKLDEIPDNHQRMLRFWVRFWRRQRDVLLDGTLEPHYPDQLYPFVLAKKNACWVGAFYSGLVALLPGLLPDELWFVNATPFSRVVVELDSDSGTYRIEESNVVGDCVETRMQSLTSGIHALKVGPSGLLRLKRES